MRRWDQKSGRKMKRDLIKPSLIQEPVGNQKGSPNDNSMKYGLNGNAKILTLFHPLTGKVCIKGVTSSTNVVLHPWLKEELSAILDTLPKVEKNDPKTNQALWKVWQEGL
jgi:hypothetical protein